MLQEEVLMIRPRGLFAALVLCCLSVVPTVARAANSEFRVFFDVDNDAASGCTISGMAGVDQVFTTRVTTTDTTAAVTRTVRQVCTTAGMGPVIDVETSGWPAGFQPASGAVTIETRLPFSAFASSSIPDEMRIGIEGAQGAAIHTAILRPDGSKIMYPGVRHRRRSVGSPGSPRVIVLDGLDLDWTGLKPLAEGIASGGVPSLRILKVTAFSNHANDNLYFLFQANLSTDAPFATDDTYPRPAGAGLAVAAPGVLENDGDPNGLPLTALPVSPAANGDVTLNPDGSFTYTPNDPSSTEADTFEYKASNGSKESNTATVTINVATSGNDDPIITSPPALSVPENTFTVGALTAIDADGDTLTFSISGGADAGSFSISGSDLTFITAPDFEAPADADANNQYLVEVTVSDGNGGTDVQLITVTVTNANEAPAFSFGGEGDPIIPENTTEVFAAAADDPDGDPLTFSISGGADAALFTIDPSTGLLSFITAPNFEAPADAGANNVYIVQISATDGTFTVDATIQVTVTNVNEAPLAVADSGYTVAEGGTLNGTTVLANDTDPEGASLTAVLVSGPTNASSFTLNANGTFAYTHNGGETTSDSFSYRANDGSLNSNIVTVTITVNAVNDAPVATADAYSVNEGGTLSRTAATGVLANDSDVDSSITAVLVSGPANASSFTLNADGSFTYTHNGSETTSDSFTYKANDGSADSSTVTVTITVTAVNDAPVAVADSGYTVNEGGSLAGAATVLGNDTDAEGSALTAVLVSGPANASSFTLHAGGTFDYTHNGGETTSDSFTYRANDGGLNSNTVTVTIAVNAINDAPVAVADSGYTLAEGGNVTGAATVLGNDSDAEGSTLTAVLVSGPANASSFTLNADGTFNYTHNGSETTSDSFTYKANDGGLDSNTVTVSITITAVNDAPVAVADSGYSVAEGGTISGAVTVLGNDTDAEASTLTAVLVSGPSNDAAFTLHADGTFDYTHDGSETTADSFTYKANDGTADSNTVTVTITVTAVNDAPVAVADSGYTLAEGGNVTGAATVLGNDTDAENDTLTAVLVSGPSNSSAFTLNSDGTFDYTHNGGETTSDSFTYKANDGTADSNTVTVSITITATNDTPVATADGYTVAEGGTLNETAGTGVLANDTDPDSTLTAVLVTGPANASSFTLNADGSFTYSHNGSETSSDSFTYKANDGSVDSSTVTVTITVTAVNDAPVAVADSGYTLAEGGNVTGAATVLGNDSDAEGSTLTAVLVSGPANASSFTLNSDGTFNYTHNGGETISDSFTYKANDGSLDSNTVTVTITITPVNDAPVAVADSGYTVAEGGNVTGAATVLGNDSDAEGTTLTAVLVSGPANASSFTLNADGTFDYTHNGSETTSDSFTYKANDGGLDSNTVTVSITITAVNDAPVAVADSGYSVAEGGTISGAVTVLGNDTDAEVSTLTAVLVSGPSNDAAFTLHADGTFDYTHDGSETTADSFTYKANDGTADSNTVTVTITITAVNDAPVAVADSGYTLTEGGNVTGAATVLGNDTDAENDTLTAVLVSGPSNSSAFTLNSDGTFDYTHNGGETTSDSFTYKANDGTADSNTVTVSITITATNDTPVATADGYTVAEGGTLNETAGTGVLANDTDPDSTLTAVLVTGPANASSFTLNADGSFDYTHNGGETSSDSFTYKANDGSVDSSTVTVTITVTAVNDAPVAVADSGYTLAEGGNVTGAATVLGNDSDAEGSTLTAVLVSGPSNASSFTLNSDGTFDYTHNGGETTSDSFTYKANDGSLDSNTVTVSITITAVNDAPVAAADSGYSLNEGATITNAATVLGNDTDAENDTLTAVLVSGPSNSSAFTLNADGTFDYTHNGGETTSDSFTYKANDGTADSNTVTVSITVNAINDAPVAVADSGYSLNEGATITGAATVLGNDTDAENDTLTAVLVSGPSNHSAFTLNSDGTFDYTHNGGETTSDSFTYKANDGTADSNVVTVSIVITPVNDVPVAVADSGYTVAEGGNITGAATVLGNDTDGENDTLTAILVSGPSNDSAFTLNSDGTFDYTHDGSETTSDSFTYKANDGTADSNTVTVSITITGINDAPTLDAIGDQIVNEDSGTTNLGLTGITAGNAGEDAAGQTVTVTAVSNNTALIPNPAVGAVTAGNATLSFAPVANQFGGPVTITVTVTDSGPNGGADVNTFQRTFTITVNSVNDAPNLGLAGDLTLLDTSGNVTAPNYANPRNAGPANEAGQTLTFTVTNDNNALFTGGGQPTIDVGTGALTFTTITGVNGVANVTVKLKDDGGVLNGGVDETTATFKITVNQIPLFTSADNASFSVGQASNFDVTVNARPTAVFSLPMAGSLPSGLSLVDDGDNTARITGTPATGTQGTYNFTIRAVNSAGQTDQAFTLIITCPVAVFTPAAGALPAGTYNSPYSQAINVGQPSYTYAITSGALPAGLALDGTNGGLTGTPTTTGNFSFTITATDTPSGCTTPAAYTLTINPSAVNDSYGFTVGAEAVGNTQVVAANHSAPTTPFVPFAGTLLANDSAPIGATATSGTFATTGSGSVTIAADGSFTYTPAPGFTGDDTFTYTLSSNGAGALGTATIRVAKRVWYVNNSVADGGTGLSSLPFDTLIEAQTASANGDIIYVDFGDGTANKQNAGITLKLNQQLIGEGVALVVNTYTLAAAGTKPLITNLALASDAVTLHDGNSVRGLTITGATRDGIAGSTHAGFTGDTLTIQNNVGSGLHLTSMTGGVTVTNATITGNGTGLDVNNGVAAITLDATNTIAANAGQRSVSVQNRPAGAVLIALNATINDSGTGILVNNNAAGTVTFAGNQTLNTTTNPAVTLSTNTGATVNFTGTLAVTTSTGSGFTATGGGTVAVSGTANITTGAAAAGVNINGVTSGGITFNSVNTTGATTGVSLTSLNNGNVTINGGTLNAGTGVSLTTLGTSNVTLNNVTVTATATGISGTTFGTLTIAGTVPVSGPTALSLTTGTVSGTFSNVTSTGGTNGVSLTGVSGTWGATAGSLTGASGVTFNVSGGSGNITWGPSITQANANRAVSIAASNSATINFNGNVTSSGTSTGVALSLSSGTYNFNGAANAFTGASGILISNAQSGTITFSNGTTNTVAGTAFQVDGSVAAVTAAITYSGTIVKASAGALIDVNNLDAPGTLTMTHTPAAAGNLSISNNGSMGISVINSSSANITIANASVTFNNAAPAFTSTNNTGGTINLQGPAFVSNGNRAGMLLAGGGTINVTTGVAAPSINMAAGSNNAIDGTTTAFAGTLSLNNTAITGGGATAVRLGGGTLSGTGSTIAAGAQTALNLSGVALANGAGLNSLTSTGGVSGVILANVTGGTYTIAGGSLTGHTTAAWVHTNTVAGNAATISFPGPITPAINARAIDIGAAGASTGLGGGTITFSGAITTTSNAANANAGGVRVRNSTAGTLTLSNTTVSISANANNGIDLATNPGTTFNFSGGNLAISSTNGNGLNATDGGTVNITGDDNTITNTGSGRAINFAGTSAAAKMGGTLRFKSVNKSGSGTKGIVVNNHSGSFTITGDDDNNGVPDSATAGGTITGTTTRGAEFVTVDGGVNLGGMTFTNTVSAADGGSEAICGSDLIGNDNTPCNAAIHLQSIDTSSVLRNVTVNGSTQTGINGTSVRALTLNGVSVQNCGSAGVAEHGATLRNLLGTNVIVNSTFSNNAGRGLYIIDTVSEATKPTVSITSSTFSNSGSLQGALFDSYNSGDYTVNVGDDTVGGANTFSGNFSNALQQSVGLGGDMTINIKRNTFNHTVSGIVLQAAGVGTTSNLNYTIWNNTVVKTNGTAANGSGAIIISGTQQHQISGDIRSNTIGNGTAGSGAFCGGGCNGITVDHNDISASGGGRHDVTIVGNDVRNVDSSGIRVVIGQKSKGNVVVTGNRVRDPHNAGGVTAFAGIYVQGGIVVADTSCLAATIGGTTNPGAWPSTSANAMNSVEGSWDPLGSQSEIVIWRKGGTLNVPGSSAPVATYVGARNNIPDATGADVTELGTIGAGASCP
jgi:VCBS repeat-containing protein